MKRNLRTFLVTLVGLSLFGTASIHANIPIPMKASGEVNWEVFSTNLVVALQSDNAGLRQSAMQLVIRYGDRLDVKDALFDVVGVFRNHKTRNVRLLALSALGHMNSNWAFDFLKRSIKFEDDPVIKRQVIATVNNFYLRNNLRNRLALASN